MNNIQKSFKNKARRGLCMADGGLLDPSAGLQTAQAGFLSSGIEEDNAAKTARWAKDDQLTRSRNGRHAPVATTQTPDSTPYGQAGTRQGLRAPWEVPQGYGQLLNQPLSLAEGGAVESPEQVMARIQAKYGVTGKSAPATAPATAPVPQRPTTPTTQPQTQGSGLADRIKTQIDPVNRMRAYGLAEGGIVRGAGGPTDDAVPMTVNGRKVNLSDTEAVLPAKTVHALGGQEAVEELIERTNGKPPVKGGLRAGGEYADGVMFDPEDVRARAAQARQINPTVAPATTSLADAASGAPKAAPLAPGMIAPEPAAPVRNGIKGVFDRASNAAKGALNSVKTTAGLGEEAAAAAKVPWYKPTGMVGNAGNAGKVLGKVSVPLMVVDGVASTASGLKAQSDRDASDIDARGGFAASTAKDSFPAISAVGAKMGEDAGRVLTAARNSLHNIAPSVFDAGGANPNTGKREGLWDALTTIDNSPTFKDYYAQNIADQGAERQPTTPPDRAPGLSAAQALPASAPALQGQVAGAAGQRAPDESNPNIGALRAAGVRGAITGDVTDDSGKTPASGIRTIGSASGNVFAGRDAKGQLNVTSGLDNDAATNEALRAKEADRMTADMNRQKDTFERLHILSDLRSNNPEDVQRGLAAMQARQQDINADVARQGNLLTARGQDMTLQGHMIDAGTRMAQMRYTAGQQQQQQRMEQTARMWDEVLGKVDPKSDPEGYANRKAFMSDLYDAFGEKGLDPSALPPRELFAFHKVWENAQKNEPGTVRKVFQNYVLGSPYVRDANVMRNYIPLGDSDALGYAPNANGGIVNSADAVGAGGMWDRLTTGERDAQLERLTRGLRAQYQH